MEYMKTPFGLKIGKATINGKAINPFKTYTVAFTEGIVKGALGISAKTLFILKNPVKSPHKIWQTLEDKVINSNDLKLGFVDNRNKTYFDPNDESLSD